MKTYWFFIILSAIAFSLGGIYLFFGKEKRVEVTPTPNSLPLASPQSWKGITPGQTQQQEVLSLLGQPEKTQVEKDRVVFSYPTQRQGIDNEVFFEKDRVGLIKEQIIDDQGSLPSFIQKFGEPEVKLFGPYASSGFLVYVFAASGIALVAHPDGGIVFETWYFTPMTLEEFRAKWGQELSETQSPRF